MLVRQMIDPTKILKNLVYKMKMDESVIESPLIKEVIVGRFLEERKCCMNIYVHLGDKGNVVNGVLLKYYKEYLINFGNIRNLETEV